jgi:hypothetical protein
MAWGHIDSWRSAAAELGVSVVGPIDVTVETGTFSVDLLVRGFGARNGMIVVTNYDTIKTHLKALLEGGYGYSCFDPPSDGVRLSSDDIIELLEDWSWAGSTNEKPAWLA